MIPKYIIGPVAGQRRVDLQRLVGVHQMSTMLLTDTNLDVADAASKLVLKWALGSAWCMQQLLLPASPLGACLHGLTLKLVDAGSRAPAQTQGAVQLVEAVDRFPADPRGCSVRECEGCFFRVSQGHA
eukprot:1143247-Pelagomonas_calceolata.AAC.21